MYNETAHSFRIRVNVQQRHFSIAVKQGITSGGEGKGGDLPCVKLTYFKKSDRERAVKRENKPVVCLT